MTVTVAEEIDATCIIINNIVQLKYIIAIHAVRIYRYSLYSEQEHH